jgi:hypothetical protein
VTAYDLTKVSWAWWALDRMADNGQVDDDIIENVAAQSGLPVDVVRDLASQLP